MGTSKPTIQQLSDWLTDFNFNSLTSEEDLAKEAEKKVLALFSRAAQEIPAYQDFLKKNHFNPKSVQSFSDYPKVPLTTKENYIDQYPAEDRCFEGTLEHIHMISTSSGTTGTPHFWPRNLQAEIEGAYAHELILKEVFQIDQLKTLLIVGFAMGNWIAGTFTLASANLVSWKGYKLTTMTPGYSAQPIMDSIRSLKDSFDQIIIAGHTPFLKELVEAIANSDIESVRNKIKLLGTGQAVSENWRSFINQTLGSKKANNFINLYGSADAALMGFETPESINIRQIVTQDSVKNKALFNENRVPSLYNYDPRLTFFEEVAGELVITKDTGCPLIRYNIQDTGGVISNQKMKELLSQNLGQGSLPFVYLFGRDKFMVKIYGANVYSEHVEQALGHNQLQPHISGRFLMEMITDDNNNPRLVCRVELKEGVKENKKLASLIQQIFIDEIRKINTEYNYVLGEMGDKASPLILLHKHSDPKYFPKDQIKKTG